MTITTYGLLVALCLAPKRASRRPFSDKKVDFENNKFVLTIEFSFLGTLAS